MTDLNKRHVYWQLADGYAKLHVGDLVTTHYDPATYEVTGFNNLFGMRYVNCVPADPAKRVPGVISDSFHSRSVFLRKNAPSP